MTALKKYAGCTQAQRVVDLAGTACPARPVHVQIGGLCSDGPSLDRGMHTPRVCSGGEGWLSRRRSACQGVNSRVMSKLFALCIGVMDVIIGKYYVLYSRSAGIYGAINGLTTVCPRCETTMILWTQKGRR